MGEPPAQYALPVFRNARVDLSSRLAARAVFDLRRERRVRGHRRQCFHAGSRPRESCGRLCFRSVPLADCLNTIIGGTAYLYGRRGATTSGPAPAAQPATARGNSPIRLPMAMFLAGLSGFLALGFEIAWFRVFSMAAADRAPAFALLLSIFLAGIAAGSYLSEKLTERASPNTVAQVIGMLLLLAGGISAYLPALVGVARVHGWSFLAPAPAFFLTAAMFGSVLPLLCQISVLAGDEAGVDVILVKVSKRCC